MVSVDSHGDIHILTLMERATAIRTAISLYIRWRAANQFFVSAADYVEPPSFENNKSIVYAHPVPLL